MIEYLIKQKIKNETKESSKKIMMYTGAILAGVGTFVIYKGIKKSRERKLEEIQFLEGVPQNENEYGYDIDETEEEDYYTTYEDQKEKDELEKKVEEFNSRRLNCENCPIVSPEEMSHYINKIKDTKKDIEVDANSYKAQDYDNYEYYDGHIINQEENKENDNKDN